MADYKNMTAIEALREAKDASGMTAESIAQGLGITATHLRRYLDPNDNYAPSLHIIPGLCRVMRNRILLQWLEAQIVADDTVVTPAATRADVLTAVARAGSALGEVQRIVAEAQVLYPSTAREIRSGLGDVIAACRSAQAGLQPLAERRDRDVALASLSDGEQAPPVAPALRPTGWPAPHPDPAVPPVVAARPARSGTPRSRPQARNGSPAPYSDKAPAPRRRSAAPRQGPNPHAPPPSAHPRASRQASLQCHQLQSALQATGGGFYSASPCTNRG